MSEHHQIFNSDCIGNDNRLPDKSVHLGIFDPPFGIKESGFDKHYNRNNKHVIDGYKEAPPDYEMWTFLWLKEATRILRDDGSMYVVMGHTNLRHLLNAAAKLGLHEINHMIWKYNFGVNTKKKYVTSHYHILYYSKSKGSKPTFNLNCRFGSQERVEESISTTLRGNTEETKRDNSALFRDLEDVFLINRDNVPNQKKNQNKLPEELVRKLILYSSNPGDLVADFFMGNFTTAYAALDLGRNVCGYELNPHSYKHHIELLEKFPFGDGLKTLHKVINIVPKNQGKAVTAEMAKLICEDYLQLLRDGENKGSASRRLQEKYGRGRFSIKNILDDGLITLTPPSALSQPSK